MANLPLDPVFYNTLVAFVPAMTAPSFVNFVIVCCGWLQCTRRHTITGMIEAAGVTPEAHHERFHRLCSQGRFVPDALGQLFFLLVVQAWLSGAAPIMLAGDDTLFKKSGRHIFGAGFLRDGVLSTRSRVVTRWGLNFVVLGLVVRLPLWPARDSCLPVLARLHQRQAKQANKMTKAGKTGKTGKADKTEGDKAEKTCPELMAEMLGVVAGWLPERTFQVAVDGASANLSVFGALPANVVLISRTRADAALHELAPVVQGQRKAGRPRSKGERLPAPRALACFGVLWRALGGEATREWQRVAVELYGARQEFEAGV